MLFSFVSRAWSALRRKSDCSAAARALHRMSDHELADIGIARDQIEDMVHGRCLAQAAGRQAGSAGLFSQRPVFAKAAVNV